MLLKSITLHNIRSYLDQEIIFPTSSTLLSGDIGSGKSTILLAIEFALFGTSPDLSGDMLLRKGQPSGSIQLTFSIDGQEVTIERQLKKEKDGIKQKAGYLILNNQRKDLTPVELKAEMINRLGYPKELASKSKNFVYRYTVYCPQELMKEILEDSPDERLNTLRKIFNVDKYKNIRDNAQLYLRTLRKLLLVRETKMERWPVLEQELTQLTVEKSINEEKKSFLQPKREQLTTTIHQHKQVLQQREQQQQRYQQLIQFLQQTTIRMEEKQRQRSLLIQRREELLQKKSTLVITATKENLESKIKTIDQRLTSHLTSISVTGEKLRSLQQIIQKLTSEAAPLLTIQNEEQCLQLLITALRDHISKKTEIQRQTEESEQRLQALTLQLQHIQTLEEQSTHLLHTIATQDHCPLCQQPFSSEHKQTITTEEHQKKVEREQQKRELLVSREQSFQQLHHLRQERETIVQQEQQLAKSEAEHRYLTTKRTELQQKQEQLPSLMQEQQKLLSEQQELQKIDLTILQQERQQLHHQFLQLAQQQEREKYLQEITVALQQLEQELQELQKQQESFKNEQLTVSDQTEQIQKQKHTLEQFLAEELQLTIELTRLQTTIEQQEQRLKTLHQERENLIQIKTEIKQFTDLHHWLDNQFIPLTQTIERQVMATIHRLFSQLFQEWFSMLLENELLSARLDDSFTPVIEQDGYDIMFPYLSGGERTSASLAYRLALNKVINEVIHEIKTKDLLILDEPTDGFSSEQLDKVRDVLERLNLKQIIIVSHESKIESFVENVIRIHKEGQVSHIVS